MTGPIGSLSPRSSASLSPGRSCDLAEFCEASHLPRRQVATSLKNLWTTAMDRMGNLSLDDVLPGEEMDFARELVAKLSGNAEWLLEIAGELPHLRL